MIKLVKILAEKVKEDNRKFNISKNLSIFNGLVLLSLFYFRK